MAKKLNKLGVENSLWNNIRANKGSGKAPTKEMLKQERKIKAKYADGGITEETETTETPKKPLVNWFNRTKEFEYEPVENSKGKEMYNKNTGKPLLKKIKTVTAPDSILSKGFKKQVEKKDYMREKNSPSFIPESLTADYTTRNVPHGGIKENVRSTWVADNEWYDKGVTGFKDLNNPVVSSEILRQFPRQQQSNNIDVYNDYHAFFDDGRPNPNNVTSSPDYFNMNNRNFIPESVKTETNSLGAKFKKGLFEANPKISNTEREYKTATDSYNLKYIDKKHLDAYREKVKNDLAFSEDSKYFTSGGNPGIGPDGKPYSKIVEIMTKRLYHKNAPEETVYKDKYIDFNPNIGIGDKNKGLSWNVNSGLGLSYDDTKKEFSPLIDPSASVSYDFNKKRNLESNISANINRAGVEANLSQNFKYLKPSIGAGYNFNGNPYFNAGVSVNLKPDKDLLKQDKMVERSKVKNVDPNAIKMRNVRTLADGGLILGENMYPEGGEIQYPGPVKVKNYRDFNYKYGTDYNEKQFFGKQPLSAEQKLDNYLGSPLAKAHVAATDYSHPEEDERDNLRHSLAGRYVTEAIANKTGNIPFISKGLGVLGANVLGAAHELDNFQGDRRDWKTKLRESGEDMFNNFAGSMVGGSPLNKGQKDKASMDLANKVLPDGYGVVDPFRKGLTNNYALPKHAGGGTSSERVPIPVNNPNDPRLRAYNDSADLAKGGSKDFMTMMKAKTLQEQEELWRKEFANSDYMINAYKNLQKLNGKGPEQYYNASKKYPDGEYNSGLYSNPVQPYVYKKPNNKPTVNNVIAPKPKPAVKKQVIEKETVNVKQPVVTQEPDFQFDMVQTNNAPNYDKTKLYQGYDFMQQTGLRPGDYTETQVQEAMKNKSIPKKSLGGRVLPKYTPGGTVVGTPPATKWGAAAAKANPNATALAGMAPAVMEVANTFVNQNTDPELSGALDWGAKGMAAGSAFGPYGALIGGAAGFIGGGVKGVFDRQTMDTANTQKQLAAKNASDFKTVMGNSDTTNMGVIQANPGSRYGAFGGTTYNGRIYANGGMTVINRDHSNPQEEVEGGESAMLPNGKNVQFNGPKHTNGGIKTSLPEGTRIFSDQLIYPGKR